MSMPAQYEENKLDESNVGFKMLKKFGWTEGKGLGASGAGIAAPISRLVIVDGTNRTDSSSAANSQFFFDE